MSSFICLDVQSDWMVYGLLLPIHEEVGRASATCIYPRQDPLCGSYTKWGTYGPSTLSLVLIFQFCPTSWTEECQIPNMVYAPHWYDLDSLFNKKYGEFTVNVQGLSRVICLLQSIFCLHLILLSRECFLSRLFIGVTKALVITSVFKYVPWLKKHTSHWERSQSCLASAVFPWTWSTCSSRVSSFRLTRYPPTVRERLLSLRILSGKSAWWMRWLLA